MTEEPVKRYPEIEVKTLRCHDVGYLLTIIHRLVCYADLREPVQGVIYSGGSHQAVIKEAWNLLFMNSHSLEMEKRYREREKEPAYRKPAWRADPGTEEQCREGWPVDPDA